MLINEGRSIAYVRPKFVLTLVLQKYRIKPYKKGEARNEI